MQNFDTLTNQPKKNENEDSIVITTDIKETEFKNLLEYNLERLVGDHDKLKLALETLHAVLTKEGVTNLASVTIYNACLNEIKTLQNVQQISDVEFDELNSFLDLLPFYINMQPIGQTQFLKIVKQQLKFRLEKIEEGFKFQNLADHRREITQAKKNTKEKQNKIETEHSKQPQEISESLLQRFLKQHNQILLGVIEVMTASITTMTLGMLGNMDMFFASGALFSTLVGSIALEKVSFHYTNRSVFTNLFYTLPATLFSYLAVTVAEQDENNSLLRNTAINSPSDETSYGSMAERLVLNSSNKSEQSPSEEIHANDESLPPVPSPAALMGESNDEQYDLDNNQPDDEAGLILNRREF